MATPTTSSSVSLSILSGQDYIDALIKGTSWTGLTITYSFPTLNSYWSTNPTYGYGTSSGLGEPWSWFYEPLTATEAPRFTAALQTWANVAKVRFLKVQDNATVVGDMRVAYTYDGTDAEAWAYAPIAGAAYGGDIWINALGSSYHGDYADGSYSFLTLIHEIGHAIGLKHPFDISAYNNVTLANSGYDSLDSVVFTVMSYSGKVGDPTTFLSSQPTTPMLLDILAIQQIYGANTTYKNGNDVYFFSTDKTYLQTIYDAGGIDQITCNGTGAVKIDLRDGYGSTVGQTIYELDQYYSPIGTVSENLWIAFGVAIENATGGSGNDSITGNDFGNRLIGNFGNDTLLGGLGDDILIGGAGTDLINGEDGSDVYIVNSVLEHSIGEFADSGNSGTDEIRFDAAVAGTLVLYAGDTGLEQAVIGTGNASSANTSGTAALNIDACLVQNAIVMIGNNGNNTLTGGIGNDTLDGKGGIDTLIGGAGNDIYVIDKVGDIVIELGDGITADGADWIKASIAIDLNLSKYDGIEDVELIGGSALNATGDGEGNQLTGNSAANILDGKGGADTLTGGIGNDTYIIDDAGDIVIETSILATEMDTVKATLSSYTLSDNLENLVFDTLGVGFVGNGNHLNNSLTGNSGNDTLRGLDGKDILNGLGGNDILEGGTGADVAKGGAGDDTYIVNIKSVGSGSTMTVALEDNVSELTGEGISDTLKVVGTYGLIKATTIVLNTNFEHLDISGTDGTLLNITGTSFANILTGNNQANILNGLGGADTLIGGDGNDTYVIDLAGDLITEASNQGIDLEQVAIASVGGSYTLSANVENATLTNTVIFSLVGNDEDNVLTGNGAANTLTGGIGNDTLDGKGGIDTLIGGAGNDIYVIDKIGDIVIELGDGVTADGADWIKASIAIDLNLSKYDGIEDVELIGGSALNATGDGEGNQLTGNSAANILDGKGGADTLTGGIGNDTYIIDDAGDIVIETSILATEIDTVQTSISFSLANAMDGNQRAYIEKLILIGVDAIDGAGNDLNNILTGNNNDNILVGGLGADILIGNAGNDTYVVDNAADKVYETTTRASTTDAGGADTVETSISFALGNFVENLTLTGSGNINGTGNTLANTLTGNSGSNVFDGKAGADTLDGGEGSDIYLIGLASDHANGEIIADRGEGESDIDEIRFAAAAASTLTLNSNTNGIEKVVIGTGAGATAVSTGTLALNVNASAVGYALEITGNSGANILTGTAYADTLNGGAGNDRLDGGSGADLLNGGTGNDTYVVDSAGDVIEETSTLATEIDTVEASLSWELGSNLERLVISGSNNLNGTGNSLNNTLTGNSGNNRLDGGEGTDILLGGAGNDAYVVDNIGDKVYETITTASTIDAGGNDFVEASINFTLGNFVENLTLTGSGNINGAGNTLANTLTGNSGNNVLDGKAGADTLDGGEGSDIYLIGLASDHVNGEIIADSGEGESDIDEIRFAAAATSTLTLNSNSNGIEKVVIGTGTGATAVSTGTLALNVDASAVGYGLSLTGNAGTNTLIGTAYDDTLDGGAGNDILNGGTGGDVLIGGLGNDTYRLQEVSGGNDVIRDLGGNDIFEWEDFGDDNTLGFSRSDTDLVVKTFDSLGVLVQTTMIEGQFVSSSGFIETFQSKSLPGDPSITLRFVTGVTGTAEGNLIVGTGVSDNISGLAGNDVLFGGLGNDTLNGGIGNDQLTGGGGADIFRFETTLNSASNVDTIQDFVSLEDVIQLENSIFTGLTTTGQLAEANFRAGEVVAAQDANDYILFDTTSGALYYDPDGNGAGAAVQFATLIGQPVLTDTDFHII